MDITISSQESIRVLSKILTLSSKLSDTLQLTPQPPNLTIRTLNATQSAYTQFKLLPDFFTTCQFQSRTPQRLAVKALIPIFRAPATVNTIHITTPPLTITVNTKTVTKTFTPPLVEGRVPTISSTLSSCHIITHVPFLQSLLQNFHSRLDEITMIPSSDSLKLVSFLDEAAPANVMLRTEMTVSSRELEQHHYQHEQPVELTLFCRPFRAAIDFCQAFEQPLTLSYHLPGNPVTIAMAITDDSDQPLVEARFVFASRLADDPLAKKRSRLSTQGRDDSQRTFTRRQDVDHQRMDNFAPVQSSGVVEATQEMRVSDTPPAAFVAHDQRDQSSDDDDDNDDDDDDDDDDFVEGTPPPEG